MLHLGPGASRKRVPPSPDVPSGNTLGSITRRSHRQKLLGHVSLETTAIYTEMNVESLRRVFSECHPAEKRWRERGA